MEVKLPQLGEGADSGTVVKILVQEGDQVEKDQTLLELENEKAVAAIPSTASGTVTKVHVNEGDTVSVGDVLASVSEGEGAGKEEVKEERDGDEKEEDEERKPAERKPRARESKPAAKSRSDGAAAKAGLEAAAAPSVRKVVRQLGIDLSRVQGTARGGRVSWEDLRDYIGWLQEEVFGEREEKSEQQAERPPPKVPDVDFSKWGPVKSEKVSATRRSIAGKMSRSWTTVPHVTQFGEADLTGLMKLKKKHDASYEKKKARLTLTAFFLKALIPVLKEYSIFNASLSTDGEEIVFKKYCHISVAVDTGEGLLAPVLRDVDKKSLLEISKELAALAEKARKRKISGEEMQGGCFTLSNLGGIGGAHFTPIVNQPESAILGAGRGEWRPRVVGKGKKIEPRLVVPLALSYDHRLIDGAMGARFIVALAKRLEDFPEEEVILKK